MKRTDGRWQVTLELSHNLDGSRNRKVFYGKTGKEAQAKADRHKAQVQLGIIDLNDTMRVADFAEHWLANTVPLTCTPNTASSYRDLLRRHALPLIGHMRLLEVKPIHIEQVMTAIADRGLRVATVKAVRRVLSTMFAAADRNSLIPNNPVAKTRMPKARPGETSRKPIPYSQAELLKLIDVLDQHPRGLLFLWSAMTGMRRGEVLAVRWSDIKFEGDRGQLTVRKQIREERIYSPDGKYSVVRVIADPKTPNSVRTVYLPELLTSRLQAHRNQLRSSNTGRGWSDEEFVFAGADGQPAWPSNMTHAWSQILKQAGLRHMPLHGLRHTFATLALANNAPLEAVSEALGHYSIAITKDMYATKVPGLARKATDAVASVIPTQAVGGRRANHGDA